MRPSARVRTCCWPAFESKRTRPFAVATAIVPVRPDAVDAENVIVLHMDCASRIRIQKIEATVEIANPKPPTAVRGQCRNIAIAENRGPGFHNLLPPQAARTHAIEYIA